MSNPKLLTNFFKAVMSQEKQFIVDLINKIDDETEEILKRLSPYDRNTIKTLYIVRNWSSQLDLLDMLNPNVDMKKIENLFNLVMNRYLHAKELELGKSGDLSEFKRPTAEEEARRRADETKRRVAQEAARRAAELAARREELARREATRLEAERLAAEETARLAAIEAARLAREAADRETAERAAREAARLAAEAETARLAAEAEQARLAQAEADRKAAEKEAARLEAERARIAQEQAEFNRRLQEQERLRREQDAVAAEARRVAREQADAVARAGVEERKAAFMATVLPLFGKLQEQMNLVSGLTPETMNSIDELKGLSPIIDEAARQLGLAEASFQQIRRDYPEIVDDKTLWSSGSSFNEIVSGAGPAFRQLIEEKRRLIKERIVSINQQEAVAKVRREAEEARARRASKEAEIAQLKGQLATLQAMGATDPNLEAAKQRAEADLNRLQQEHRTKATKAAAAEEDFRRAQEALAAQVEFVRQVQEKAQKKLAEVNILRDRITVFGEPKLSLAGKESKLIKVGYEAGELKRAGALLKGYIYGYMKDQLQQLRDDILDLFDRIKVGNEQSKDAAIKQQLIDALTKDTTGALYQDLTEVKKGAVPNRFWKDFNTVKIEYGYEKNQTVHTDFDTFLNRFITFAESVNRQNIVIHFPTKSEGEYKWLINPALIGEIKSIGNKYVKMTFDGTKTETQFWRLDKLDIQEGGGESYQFKFEFVVEYSAEGKEFTGAQEEAQGVLDTLVQSVKAVIMAGIKPVLGAAPAQQLDEDSEREIAEAKAREEVARREAEAKRLAKEQADRDEQDSDRAEKEAAARAREAEDRAREESGILGSDRDRQVAELRARLAAAEAVNGGLVDADVDALAVAGLTPPSRKDTPESRQSTPSIVDNVLGALGLGSTPSPSSRVPTTPTRPGRLSVFEDLAASPSPSATASPLRFELDSLDGSRVGTPSSRQGTPSSRQGTPDALRLFAESDARLNAGLDRILAPPPAAGLAAGAVLSQYEAAEEAKLSAEFSSLFDKVNELRGYLNFLTASIKKGTKKEEGIKMTDGKEFNKIMLELQEFQKRVKSYPKLFTEVNEEIIALQDAYTQLYDTVYNSEDESVPPPLPSAPRPSSDGILGTIDIINFDIPNRMISEEQIINFPYTTDTKLKDLKQKIIELRKANGKIRTSNQIYISDQKGDIYDRSADNALKLIPYNDEMTVLEFSITVGKTIYYIDFEDRSEKLAAAAKKADDVVGDRLVGGGIGNVHREKYLKYKQKYHSLKRKHNM